MSATGLDQKACILIAVFAFTFMLLAQQVEGATVRPYTPGGSPCAGACTFDWAKDQFDVPDGQPVPIIIPQGSYIHFMSYAKRGKPFWETNPAVFANDEPGIGYWFTDADGLRAMMVRINACMNWAVVTPPAYTIASDPAQTSYPAPAPASASSPGLASGFRRFGAGSISGFGSGGSSNCCDMTPIELAPPQTPSPVPISGSVVFLLLALIALILVKRHDFGPTNGRRRLLDRLNSYARTCERKRIQSVTVLAWLLSRRMPKSN